ncbi:MAG TPA: site-2 protease family protein [Acidobacteriaceae bacterium]|jgi:Zn-dependent protease|nr:site-2 protease family protein [Acidobacteriaceae bacterium]
MLPTESKEAAWVRERLQALDGRLPALESTAVQSAAAGSPSGQILPPAAPPKPSWVKRLGPFGPLALLLLKFKTLFVFLFKFKFLLSFAFYIALYVGIFGWRYGLGISACILIHEMGHFIDIKRRGLPADMPVFLPGFGAYVRWNALGVTRRQIAQISLAGPLAGWIAAAVCFLLYAQTGDPIWAALARTGAFLNILNLIPVWVLDGGQAAATLGLVERAALLATSLGLWYYTGEGIFVLVAAGFLWRLFTKDKPAQFDWSTLAYYAALLAALAVVLHASPNQVASQAASSF